MNATMPVSSGNNVLPSVLDTSMLSGWDVGNVERAIPTQTESSNTFLAKNDGGPNLIARSRTPSPVNTESRSNETTSDTDQPPVSRGGVITPFPWKLHDMLERVDEDGYDGIVSWQPHGRCFAVHKPAKFVEEVMPKYFNQTKFASFQRQLNLYGFHRLTTGRDKGAYYHESFLRGKRHLVQNMTRQKVKGTKVRRAMAPALEPNFYGMSYMPTKNGDSASVGGQLPSTDTARRLMRTVTMDCELSSLIPKEEEEDKVCFFEGQPFHFLDESNILPPSNSDASSLKRENTVIRGWMQATAAAIAGN